MQPIVQGPETVLAWPLLLLALAAFGAVARRVIAPGLTRPRFTSPDPPTMELRPEPPALVNLLVNRWRLTPAAAPATLLDLAARGHLDLADPTPEETGFGARCRRSHRAADPNDGSAADGGLTAYERRVLAHVAAVAGDGEAPTAALTTGPPAHAARWWDAFCTEVIADARRRGLSRPPVVVPWERRWLATGVVAGLAACAAAAWARPGAATLVTFVLTAAVVSGIMRAGVTRERDTPAGRAAAAHWLGVRAALANDPSLYDLPPSGARLWGRPLAYAAACGLAKAAVRALPIGPDSDRWAWSQQHGTWRRVAVHRPTRITWGWHPRAALAFAVLLIVLPLSPLLVSAALALGVTPGAASAPVRLLLVVIAAVLARVILGGVRLAMRAVAELTAEPLLVEGTVAHLRPGGPAEDPDAQGQAAIDTGSGGPVTAFEISAPAYAKLRKGARVRLTVGPYLGHVDKVEILAHGPEGPPGAAQDQPAAATAASPGSAAGGNGRAPRPASRGPALTEQDISQVLGWPVKPPTSRADDDTRTYRFRAAAGPSAEVVVTVAGNGHADRILAPVAERGWPLTTLGEEAFGCRGAVAFRAGRVAVAIRLRGAFTEERSRQILETLATTAKAYLEPAGTQPQP